jgi:hypothetical protein
MYMAINIYEELKYHGYSRFKNICSQWPNKTRHLWLLAYVGAQFVDLFKYTIKNEFVALILLKM